MLIIWTYLLIMGRYNDAVFNIVPGYFPVPFDGVNLIVVQYVLKLWIELAVEKLLQSNEFWFMPHLNVDRLITYKYSSFNFKGLQVIPSSSNGNLKKISLKPFLRWVMRDISRFLFKRRDRRVTKWELLVKRASRNSSDLSFSLWGIPFDPILTSSVSKLIEW